MCGFSVGNINIYVLLKSLTMFAKFIPYLTQAKLIINSELFCFIMITCFEITISDLHVCKAPQKLVQFFAFAPTLKDITENYLEHCNAVPERCGSN